MVEGVYSNSKPETIQWQARIRYVSFDMQKPYTPVLVYQFQVDKKKKDLSIIDYVIENVLLETLGEDAAPPVISYLTGYDLLLLDDQRMQNFAKAF